jgi:lysophospholipase L1-like esterase
VSRGKVRVGLLAALVVLAVAPSSAGAQEYKLRAIGDSVTSGFGYCGDGERPGCGAGHGEVTPAWNVLSYCLGGDANTFDNRCSANWGDTGASRLSITWPARAAHSFGIGDFGNRAAQGATPAAWDVGGPLNGVLREVIAEQPRVVAMTLGANPLLRQFALGKFTACNLALTHGELRRCVETALDEYNTVGHLTSVYDQILSGSPQTQLIVSHYHHPVPAPAYLVSDKVEVIINRINAAIGDAVLAAKGRFGNRITLIAPAGSPWPMWHQCTPIQATAVTSHLLSFGTRGMAPGKSSTPWVLTNDACTHPSADGYVQFSEALRAVLPRANRGGVKRGPAERPLEVELEYRAVELGHDRPVVGIRLNREADLEVDVARNGCIREVARSAADGDRLDETKSCDSDEELEFRRRQEVEGERGLQEVEIPVWQGYYTVRVEARDGRDVERASADLVQMRSGALRRDFEGTELADRFEGSD